MLEIKIGNLFDSRAETLVNTVNCVGVMGKGIAAIFKEKYPEMFTAYQDMCARKEVQTGRLYPYYQNGKVRILNFPTKKHWRSSSKIEYIESGLNWFVQNYEVLGIRSIAFPPLGCGNGGLDWNDVGPLMYEKLVTLPIDIEIYAPYGTSQSKITSDYLKNNRRLTQSTGVYRGEMCENWNLVLYIVKLLESSKYSVKVGRTIFQKICYVLTRYGTDLQLSFVRGTYGPYSQDIKKMITILSNQNLITEEEYGKMLMMKVSDKFVFHKENYAEKDLDNAARTFDLFRRIKDTEQAELITTILFSFDSMKQKQECITENDIVQYIAGWKKRYAASEYEYRIRELTKNLTFMGLIQVDYTKGYKPI